MIDNFSDDLNDGHIFWEVANAIDIDVNTFFFCFLPKLRCSVLLLWVRDELGCVLSLLIGVKDRKVNHGIKSWARIRIEISEADRRH